MLSKKVMGMDEELACDLHQHLSHRMKQVMQDHLDTCARGGLSQKDAISSIVSTMVYELTVGVVLLDMSEREMLDLCQRSYRFMKTNPPTTVKKRMKQ